MGATSRAFGEKGEKSVGKQGVKYIVEIREKSRGTKGEVYAFEHDSIRGCWWAERAGPIPLLVWYSVCPLIRQERTA